MNLREAKKQRTRASIIDAVLTLGTAKGLEATTIGAIAAKAEIGPRTFFRFFPTKEDAVVAPEAELFQSLLDALSDAQPNETLGTAASQAFDEALDRCEASGWERFRCSALLLESCPSANAAAMALCARTREQLHTILRSSFRETPGYVIELALEGVLSAWRLARRDWIADGGTGQAELRTLLRRNLRTLDEQPLAGLRFSSAATGS